MFTSCLCICSCLNHDYKRVVNVMFIANAYKRELKCFKYAEKRDVVDIVHINTHFPPEFTRKKINKY